jgi:glycosyltransferase involved in cell wall biosynthesis
MKIGIDAKWYFSGPVSGRIFIHNILKEFIQSYPEIEFHIFLKLKDKKLRFPLVAQNLNIHYVRPRLNMLSNIFTLPKYANRLGLDAVLFQTFCPRGRSFRSVVFIHDVLFRDYPQFFSSIEKFYFWPLKWMIRAADRVITTTEYVKNELTTFDYLKKDQPIDLTPLGVAENFRPIHYHDSEFLKIVREKHKLPNSYILFVGRLNTRKNIENLIRALEFINDKKIFLVITGEKDWRIPRLKSLLRNKEISSRITFTAAVSNKELAAIYAMAKVFCFPSFAEGFGLPPLEAMASGIPVVVSKTTSMPEVCGNAALYIDPDQPEDIAGNINKLLENEILYNEKVKQGLEWSKSYTWKKTADAIMKSILATLEKMNH